VKGQLRISRVRRPRATLLAILLLEGVYCALGLWAHGHIVMSNNTNAQAAEQQFEQKLVKQIETVTHILIDVVHEPSISLVRVFHRL